MIPLLADEDFNARIIRGLRRLARDVNLLSVHDVDLAGQSDSDVIGWATANNRVLLTHDVNTMLDAAVDRLRLGQQMHGVIAVPQSVGIGAAIADLALIVNCAEPSDLAGQIWFLPL